MENKINLINKKAERIAEEIHKEADNSIPSSILMLLKWIENKINKKIKISYVDMVGKAGTVYFNPKEDIFRVWIKAGDPEFRQRFTICHEFAHIIKNFDLKYNFSSKSIFLGRGEERFCDRFAAAFLMPKKIFMEKWTSNREDEIYKKLRLAHFFNVSGEAVYYRAKELGLLKKGGK